MRCLGGEGSESGLFGYVPELSTALVQVEADADQPAVVDGAVVVVADRQVEETVTVHVRHRGTSDIVLIAVGLPVEDLRVDLGEPSRAIREEQAVGARHKDVCVPVAVEVGHRDPETMDSLRDTGVLGDVAEPEPALVAEQYARAAGEAILGDEQVVEPVAVVVEDPY
jgi:hypothetical protein